MDKTTLRLLIADDHELVLDTLAHFLNAQDGISVTTAQSQPEVLERIAQDPPFDLVVLDYQMPGMDGLDGLTATLSASPARVAVMSGSTGWPLIERALERGAHGFIPKTLPAQSFLDAVRRIVAGEVHVPAEGLTSAGPQEAAAFKPVELDVLIHLCEGRPNKAIAHALGLTEVTVKMHVKSICGKLGAANRTQAVIIAKREHII